MYKYGDGPYTVAEWLNRVPHSLHRAASQTWVHYRSSAPSLCAVNGDSGP